jgi:hypothetical protein
MKGEVMKTSLLGLLFVLIGFALSRALAWWKLRPPKGSRRLRLNMSEVTFGQLVSLAENRGTSITEIVRVGLGLAKVAVEAAAKKQKSIIVTREGKAIQEIVLPRMIEKRSTDRVEPPKPSQQEVSSQSSVVREDMPPSDGKEAFQDMKLEFAG